MQLQGLYVAMVTPFLKDGSIDERGLRNNIEFLIDNGVAGVVPCGTTGESATLSWEEHNRVVDIAVETVKKRCTVIAGAGSNNTRESIEAARHASDAGADAILCITPYYNKPTQEGLYLHYREIATSAAIDVILYNVPGRTGVNLLPTTVERLCEFGNIIGVKEASANLENISDIHRRCGERITILSGDDMLTLPICAVGGRGVISVVGNIVPRRAGAMLSAFFEGDMRRARQVHEELLPVSQAMFIETNPVPVKTAMNFLGLAAGPVRLPLSEMSADNKKKLFAVLESGNIARSGA